jgi:hypothetical protein
MVHFAFFRHLSFVDNADRLYQTEAVYKPLLSAAGASASDYVISSDADLRSWSGSEKPALCSDRVIISPLL